MFRSFKDTNWEAFRMSLHLTLSALSIPADRNLSNIEINSAIIKVNKLITSAVESHSVLHFSKDKKFHSISDKTKKLIELRSIWLKQLKRVYHNHLNRMNPEYLQLHSRIQCLSKIIKENVDLDLNSAFKSRLNKIKPSPFAFKEIDKITGRKFFGTDISKDILTYNGEQLITVERKLDAFKDFYSSAYSEPFSSDDRVFENEVFGTVSDFKVEHCINTLMSFSTSYVATSPPSSIFTSPEKVNNYRVSLNNKKSTGIDNISNFILRKCPHSLDTVLSLIFNNCINNGYFPIAWKQAKVLPLAKTRGTRDVKNFRPISLLSNMGKLFERVLEDHLSSFSEEKNVIPKNQFGFKKQCSTEHALLVIQNKVIHGLRNKKSTVCLDIDLEKAFDSIWHDGLIFKLIKLRYPDWLTRLILSFLTNRSSSIFISSEASNSFSVSSGVPQGSILGPSLFNIYLQDFPMSDPMTEEPGSVHFADDTTILASDARPSIALNKIKRIMPLVENYYKKWRLKINTSKCGITCFRNASGKGHYLAVKESKELSLKINNIPIPLRCETYILGVNFHSRFIFNNHARKTLNKARIVAMSLKPLWNSKQMLCKSKLLMYKTLIRPILTYGFPIWFTISPSVAKEMESFERKLLRFCCGKFRKPDKKWFSNKFIYKLTNMTPLMIYNIELLFKKLNRISLHPNPIVRSLIDSNNSQSLYDNYYLSPLNTLNENSLSLLRPDANGTLSVTFYEKASSFNYRR